MWDLVKIFGKPMSDPFFEQMDPVEKLVMFYNWLEDKKDNYELAKQHGLLVGSFINPDAAKKMSDDSNVIKSSEQDFEKSMNLVKEINENIDGPIRKRKKKLINK